MYTIDGTRLAYAFSCAVSISQCLSLDRKRAPNHIYPSQRNLYWCHQAEVKYWECCFLMLPHLMFCTWHWSMLCTR